MMYQAEFSDDSILTFEAAELSAALVLVSDHAHEGEQFLLKSRRSEQTAWGDVNRTSYWEVNYPDKKAACRRVR